MSYEELKIKNRIALLESRTKKDNGRIVKKLQRQLKNIQKKEK